MQFWFGRINYEVKTPKPSDLSLERMRTLLKALGNPQDRIRIVHIAGTKGKGSTSAMLASVLRRAGFRTGLFTSPHLVRVEERIQIDHKPIRAEELVRLIGDIKEAALRLRIDDELTFFEVATALGFLHFMRRRVDVAVVEVGLGGRFDSTNVCTPLLSLITSISFDHTKQLGNTLDCIAMEKAGIIKPGRPAVSSVRGEEASRVIAEIAVNRAAPLKQLDADFTYRHEAACVGESGDSPTRVQVTTWRGTWPWLDVGLIGEHQAANAALTVAAIETLRGQGLPISDRAVAEGLARVDWPARLEILGRHPLVLLDCAHNVASAHALMTALKTSFPLSAGSRRLLIFAGSRDKDLTGMLRLLVLEFDRIFFTTFDLNPRGVLPKQLLQMLRPEEQARASLCANPADAWARARADAAQKDMICATGSVFLAGELRPLLLGASSPTGSPNGS